MWRGIKGGGSVRAAESEAEGEVGHKVLRHVLLVSKWDALGHQTAFHRDFHLSSFVSNEIIQLSTFVPLQLRSVNGSKHSRVMAAQRKQNLSADQARSFETAQE